MASDSSASYLVGHADLPSLYYETNTNNHITMSAGMIDLGLSLKVLQPQTNDNSHSLQNPHDEEYQDLVEWNQLHPSFESPVGVDIYPRKINSSVFDEIRDHDQRSDFVKVNMDGVFIGRKICLLDHSNYSSLATQLEDMFGKQSLCGIRLFESCSEFLLWYKDKDEQWRIAGDIPWKEFVDSVKRIRIMLKDETRLWSTKTMI